eukprot:6580914-Pyramimonas_sp.AAC.1
MSPKWGARGLQVWLAVQGLHACHVRLVVRPAAASALARTWVVHWSVPRSSGSGGLGDSSPPPSDSSGVMALPLLPV